MGKIWSMAQTSGSDWNSEKLQNSLSASSRVDAVQQLALAAVGVGQPRAQRPAQGGVALVGAGAGGQVQACPRRSARGPSSAASARSNSASGADAPSRGQGLLQVAEIRSAGGRCFGVPPPAARRRARGPTTSVISTAWWAVRRGRTR
jgi:hypothetical protein